MNFLQCRLRRRLIVLAVCFVCCPSLGLAQKSKQRFQEGDAIEYLWGSDWYPGTVLGVEGNAVAIEYSWGNSLHRERVDPLKLRFAWEAQAITPMRFWSDAAKQFKVRAAALSIDDGNVLLHKEDGEEVSVPIAKLSDADQRLLAKFKAQMGPAVARLPELSPFTTMSAAGWDAAWQMAEDLSGLAADPSPSFASLPMKGAGFPKAHFFETLIRVQPIGGSEGWVAAGTVDQTERMPSRLLWVALTSAAVKRVQLLPPGERLTAVDPRSRQILTINTEGPRLTLWTGDPTTEELTGKKSWLSGATDKHGSWNNWAAIVSPNHVLHEWGRQQFVVWDVEQEREVYRIEQESFFSARPALSPSKRYIALPEDKRVRIIESATGNTLASLPIEGGSAAGVGFSPDGARLAILTRSQLAVWQFGSDQPPQRFRADTIGTPFTAEVEWVDEHLLLIDRETLYDTRLELPVWRYVAKTFEVKKDTYGEKTQMVVDGKLCYAVELRGQQEGFIVGAVELPGPGVRTAVENVDEQQLYAIGRGHRFRLDLRCGEHDQSVRQWLLDEMDRNGWIYDANAASVIQAEMGRGETQTVTYRSMTGGSAQSQSVTITPFINSLQVLYDGKIAWQAGGGSGVPPVMFLHPGESAQARVNSMQKQQPEFFRDLEIPERLLDPTKKNGLGSSLISAQGLTPQPPQ